MGDVSELSDQELLSQLGVGGAATSGAPPPSSMSNDEIAAELGLPAASIGGYLKRYGSSIFSLNGLGEDIYNAGAGLVHLVGSGLKAANEAYNPNAENALNPVTAAALNAIPGAGPAYAGLRDFYKGAGVEDITKKEDLRKAIAATGEATVGSIPFVGTAYDKAQQYVNPDYFPTTTPEEDAKRARTQALALGELYGVGKGASVFAKGAPELANTLDRKSLGTFKSDYGKANDLRVIDTPERGVETYTKAALDDLLQRGELGTSRDPGTLIKTIEEKTTPLRKVKTDLLKSYDESGAPPVEPSFPLASKYLDQGKVPADLVESYSNRLDKLRGNIKERGQGSLQYLEQQKEAFGKSWDPLDKVKSGFERAIYTDLKNAIEGAVPDVAPLNAELGKFRIAEKIAVRSLREQENASPLTKFGRKIYTTGGVGLPALVGTHIAGPIGTAAGVVFGLGTEALASRGGQALIARVLRGAGRAASPVAGAFDSVFGINKKDGGPDGGESGSQAGGGYAGGDLTPVEGGSGPILRPDITSSNAGTSSPVGETALGTKSLSNESLNLTPSHKYSPDISAADVLRDPGFISHYYNTIKAFPELQKLMGNWAGKNEVITDIKNIETAAGKIRRKIDEKKYGYDETQIGDLIRGQIIVKTPADAMKMLEKIDKSGLIEGPIENYFTSPKPENYRGVHVNIRTPEGNALAEIQIHTPITKAIQNALHPLFEKFRLLSPEEKKAGFWNYVEKSQKIAARVVLKDELQNAEQRGSSEPQQSGSPIFRANKGKKEKVMDESIPTKKVRQLNDEAVANNNSPITADILDAVRYVESANGTKLKSPSGAEGPYQFMPATAKAYGLRDPYNEAASRAAAKRLLEDEYNALGSVELALASYNLGRPKLLKAIQKAGTSNWEDVRRALTEMGITETANYVPKINKALKLIRA